MLADGIGQLVLAVVTGRAAMNGLKLILEGSMLADIVAVLGGLNIIAGELDR